MSLNVLDLKELTGWWPRQQSNHNSKISEVLYLELIFHHVYNFLIAMIAAAERDCWCFKDVLRRMAPVLEGVLVQPSSDGQGTAI